MSKDTRKSLLQEQLIDIAVNRLALSITICIKKRAIEQLKIEDANLTKEYDSIKLKLKELK